MEQQSIMHHLSQIYHIIIDRLPKKYHQISYTQRTIIALVVIIIILSMINISLLTRKHDSKYSKYIWARYFDHYDTRYDPIMIEDMIEESQKRHKQIEREFDELQKFYHKPIQWLSSHHSYSYKNVNTNNNQRSELSIEQNNWLTQWYASIEWTWKQRLINKLKDQNALISESWNTIYFSWQLDPETIIEIQ